MPRPQKPTVTFGGVELSGHVAVGWKFQTGVRPFKTKFSVINADWERTLKDKVGKPLTLDITDSRGARTTIKELFILHIAPSSKPSITTFVVADRRWRWDRSIVARSYNLSRKTGDTLFDQRTVPVEGLQEIPAYDYRPYSLRDGVDVWTARDAVLDVLNQLEEPFEGRIILEGFSARDSFTLQNVVLRDAGDAALARLMAFIPGTDVWIDGEGAVRVINTLDLDIAERHLRGLPPFTWDGDKPEVVDRKAIRPSEVRVYYEREVEFVLEYSDDLRTGVTTTRPPRNRPYIENVIPTTNVTTNVTEYDPETNRDVTRDVPAGTWVTVSAWLAAMDLVRPQGSKPWTFDTIKRHWLIGNLEAALAPVNVRGEKKEDKTNAVSGIAALRENFRQTFRISRRYMERIQGIEAVRSSLLDPVTGMRMRASVWGQICLVAKQKGQIIASRKDENKAHMYYNVDSLPDSGERLVDRDPGPQRVDILDPEAGIIRISAHDSPYGTFSSIIPSFVVNNQGAVSSPVMDLGQQDKRSLGAGMRMQNGTNEVFLDGTMRLKVMLTMTPGAPNNKSVFHPEIIDVGDLAERFEGRFKIQDGEGPVLEVFIPPSEVTARFAWVDDGLAQGTIGTLLGLNDDDPTRAGLGEGERDLSGFSATNRNREVFAHSRAVAAEAVQTYADSVEGRVTTIIPANGLTLKGNQSGVTISVSPAPSAKVMAVHEFPGQSAPISRFALLPETTRKVTLGIVRFR